MRWLPNPPVVLVLLSLGLGGCATNQNLSAPGEDAYPPPNHAPDPAQSETAQQLWQVFERYEGTPYRYGGTTPEGFDCSGFILTAYREALNLELPRTTSQMLSAGNAINRSQLQPGDLVFFNIRGKEQHAGIYMGSNRFIHSSTSVGVTQSSLDGYYWKGRFTQARRFD